MSQPLHRRTVLKCIVAVAASTASGCHDDDDGPPTEDRQRFPQSVASGDPRPDRVVLWTRAVDPANADADVELTLQVARSADFRTLVLERKGLRALAEDDHTLRVQVTNLAPRTVYFYRFVVDGQKHERFSSPVGRTRTAPSDDADVPARFVVANCQDFLGRYYNAWQRLLQLDEDLDCVVFLGDYIYETVLTDAGADPRSISFGDPGSALPLPTAAGGPRLAAQSVSNYRDIYRAIRSDPLLQQVHERYPFIVVWDDHEFSDDCWDAHANYTDGRMDEFEPERRRNAEQAFFEYQPLDVTAAPAGPVGVDSIPRYPDARIWRDLSFGRHLRLLVTDYRSYRPDHLIPEDAWPGAVVMDAAVLLSLGLTAAFAADTFAYVDIDAAQNAPQKVILRAAYVQLAVGAGLSLADAIARAEATVRGNVALAYANAVLTQAGAPPLDPTGKPRGIAFVHLGKTDLFSRLGARYVVIKDTFDIYAAWRFGVTGGASEDALGQAQEQWLLAAAREPGTWKVVVSSVSPTAMIWDLSNKADVPAQVRNRYAFDVDQWDGFPDRKRQLLEGLRTAANERVVFVAGDIHASFASVELGVAAVTAPAVSSSSIQEEAAGAVTAAGFPPGSAVYRYVVTEQEATLREGNPGIAFVDTDSHGFTVVEVGPEAVRAAYHLIPSSEVRTDYSARPEDLAARFTRRDFRITPGVISAV
ncbi:alkaline phosphatase D family protein [Corallococcus sicarius]|uniref:alkaline phosphatase D family protein n=1 Tax=Corallococcus sicarius TaxID=2316726 RepID=UPI001FC946C0|nr:alkaline phosphatase D family protein [Corallococcus sicarius]